MFVLENNIAVLADLAFNSGSHSTIPNALFWFGQITNQTLEAIITPSHMPIPIAVCLGIPDPILKVIAPAALFYFRWAAAFTVLSGLILAWLNGYLHQAMTLGIDGSYGKNTAIGLGMWLGIIMAYNVWFVIWPNQKKALGIVECTTEVKAKSAKMAMLFSRTNTLLSLPMLLTMVAAQNLY